MRIIKTHPMPYQSGFTLIDMMFVVAIIGILAAIATMSYQAQTRKTQVVTIYQESSHFQTPYQTLIYEGAGVTDFSPNGLNMPTQTKYCQFSITAPNTTGSAPNAIQCQIQNLDYLSNQTLSFDRAADGSWTCRASLGISRAYLPQACR